MKKIITILKNNRYWIFLILLIILKIIIVQVQPLNAKYTMKYDDQLMVEMAENIVDGNWLGEYNSKTLIKGVFTPLFISFLYILHIPFLIGKEIFYGISCIVLTIILGKKIKSKGILILIYIVLLFNPIEYSEDLSRVYRDEIYISLIMYLLAFSLGIFFCRKEKIKKQIKYYIGFGITISATYLCREETIWLIPFIIFILIATWIPILLDKKLENKVKRISLSIIPIFILVILINIICVLNYKYYGVYTLNQYWGKAFESAYGALTRVLPEQEKKRVPVTNKTLQKLYKFSPKLAELQSFFEGQESQGWKLCGERIEGEINGGYFHWALMEAVENRGYYQNAKMADKYYLELAEEINTLCDNNIIKARGEKRVSNTCYFDYKDILDVIKNLPKTIQYQYKLTNVEMKISNPSNVLGVEDKQKKMETMEKMTNQKIETTNHYVGTWNSIRLEIIEKIKDIYKFLNTYFIYISVISLVLLITINIKRLKNIYEEIIILGSLIIIYFARIFIVTFTSTMMYREALNVGYLSSIYNIQYLFGILSTYFFIKTVINIKKGAIDEEQNNNINTMSNEEILRICIEKVQNFIKNCK